MEQIFKILRQKLQEGQDVTLVSIIKSGSSVPRSAGAHMMVSSSGKVDGTIGGGQVEFEAEHLAKQLLQDKQNHLEYYQLSPNHTHDLGMICGGNVDVSFHFIASDKIWMKDVVDYLCKAYKQETNVYLIREFQEKQILSYVYEETDGCLQNRTLEYDFSFQKAMQYIEVDKRIIVCEQVQVARRVYVFGGGHVAQALVPVLQKVGFRCTVLEDCKDIFEEDALPEEKRLVLTPFTDIDVEKITKMIMFVS